MEMSINENQIERPSNNEKFEQKEKEMEELELIVGTVAYSLPVALIKICILNKYIPLEIEKYYDLVQPVLPMLKKTNGAKYTTNNIKTIRSAMLSDQLFSKNDDGLYELNIRNAIEHIRLMQKRKQIDEQMINERKFNKENKKFEKEERRREIKNKINIQQFLNKKREDEDNNKKNKKGKKFRKPISYGKYGNAYNLFNNLLKIIEENQNIYTNLNLDLDSFNALYLDEDSQYNHKVIGMLTAFKFFRPFLEKNFNCFKVQKNVIEKVSDLANEIGRMKNIIKSNDF